AEGFLQSALPVAAQHERVVVAHVIVDANDRRAVVGLALRRNRRQGKGHTEPVDETLKASRGVRLRAESFERERAGRGDGLERVEAAPQLESAEVEELVRDNRAADAARELMLRV